MDALILHLEGPLMAFGGPLVDEHGVIDRFPPVSMIAGLLANAMGFDHSEPDRIQRLQERLVTGSRLDVPGREIVDFHTVDLGQESLDGTGWTTWGRPEGRGGGSASTGTHIRYRHYRAGASCTVVVALRPPDESPDLEALEAALKQPARPLFLGRKTCLPSIPVSWGRVSGGTILEMLKKVPAVGGRRVEARWPAGEGGPKESLERSVTDERDWRNQIHCGERLVLEGWIEVEEAGHE